MFFFFLGAPESFDSPRLERTAQVLELLQQRYPTMTLAMLTTFLRIGTAPAHEGDYVSVSEIVEKSPGRSFPTVARQIELLGDGNVKSIGLGLIERRADPDDRRNRHVAISERGKQLLYEVDTLLSPDLLDDMKPARDPAILRTKENAE